MSLKLRLFSHVYPKMAVEYLQVVKHQMNDQKL